MQRKTVDGGHRDMRCQRALLGRRSRIIRWHPLRAFNAMNVRVLGTDLLTVRVQLLLPGLTRDQCESKLVARQRLPRGQLVAHGGLVSMDSVDGGVALSQCRRPEAMQLEG